MSSRGRTAARSRLLGVVVFAALFVLQMTVLLTLSPRLFWLDDAAIQYSPAMWWLGRHQVGLIPPLMNPELGGAASFATDMQYGVLDPLHWVWQAVASRFTDMAAFSALYGCVCLLVVGSGVLVQLLLRQVRPVLAASVAVGVSSSGFLLWFGSDWWPLLWSAGWVCWIWNGLWMRSWPGLLVLGASTAALLTSGYPYFLSFAAILVLIHLVEEALSARSARVLIARRPLLQYAAMTGGLVYALPTLLTMLQSRSLTIRPVPDALYGNSSEAVPNLLDVVLGSPTLLGDTGFPTPGPWTVTYAFIITVPLVALIRWDRLLRVPGALTGAVVAGLAIGATQLPAVVLGFRNPFLYLTMVEIFLPITLIVLVVHARRFTRRRVVLAALIVVGQVLLTVLRAPHFAVWSAAALVVLGAALLAVLLYLSPTPRFSPRVQRVVATGVAVLSITPSLMAMGTLISLQNAEERLGLIPERPAAARQPFRSEPAWSITSPSVSTFAARSIAPGSSASVYDFRDMDIDGMFPTGSFAGNQNLFADASLGYGYSPAVSQENRAAHDCRGHFGAACSPDGLLAPAPAPAEGERWIDVLSQPVVLVNADAPNQIVTYLRTHWDETVAPDGWLRFEKRDRLPGRITTADHVQVASTGWETTLGRIGSPMEHYTVTTRTSPGSLVFYTTYWPGLQATVNGRATPVTTLDGTVLKIDLPAGLNHARLDVTYAPIGSTLLPLTIAGTALIVLTTALGLISTRTRRWRLVG